MIVTKHAVARYVEHTGRTMGWKGLRKRIRAGRIVSCAWAESAAGVFIQNGAQCVLLPDDDLIAVVARRGRATHVVTTVTPTRRKNLQAAVKDAARHNG